MEKTTEQPSISEILSSVFGYDSFRDRQEEIINNALKGNDSLVIMPTGGGKSLCYQVPALTKPGMGLVISPLIALMNDQVTQLVSMDVSARAINSQLSPPEKELLLQEIENEKVKLLYISPELAVQRNFVNFIAQQNINLIAIDEAHCVSIWGNDFRPEYSQLGLLLDALPNTPRIALTATADKATQKDIAANLHLREPQVFLSSFERKNISSSVMPAQGRMKRILEFLHNKPNQPGIIYTLSRKSAEALAGKLQKEGFQADYYHGRMSTEARNSVQDDFKNDEIQIVCATIAFGMGIDKSNINWVIHYNLPKNLESYYQEIGRSGRDGSPAETLLFFSFGDVSILRSFIDDSEASNQFKEVQRAKLERMVEYCQATSCRTNIVLSYFGEHRTEPCGRCDNCLNPPEKIDGTVLAQKVLSAVKRVKEQAPITTIISVLRGAQNQEVYEHNYQNVKTYGILKEIPYFDLFQYVTQLINLGLLEIDCTQKSRLKVTALGDDVLFNGKKVELTTPVDKKKAKPEKKEKRTKKIEFENSLFEALKKKRLELAKKARVPAYAVFTDKTLQEIASEKPLDKASFSAISGVGQAKLEKYADIFISFLRDEITTSDAAPQVKGKTYIETLNLLNQGKSPDEIADARNLNITTIYGHMATLIEKGENVNTDEILDKNIQNLVIKTWRELEKPAQLKPIHEALNEKVPFHLIKLSLAYARQNES